MIYNNGRNDSHENDKLKKKTTNCNISCQAGTEVISE